MMAGGDPHSRRLIEIDLPIADLSAHAVLRTKGLGLG